MNTINEQFKNYTYTVVDRFLKYVQIDTQSDPNSTTFPSTEKQKDLARVLVEELKAMGMKNAEMDENGYVYAELPSNTNKQVPTIFFCAHMDTSPDCSGKNVKPIIHKNYQGQNIVLPDDPSQVLTVENHPELKNQIGNDIITASGTTLLGADNKAGVAEIMDAMNFLIQHPEIKHGTIKVVFTPDEEVGRGTEKINLQKLNAQYGYTIDGETLGHIENETFSADMAIVEIQGYSTHPGLAKNKMENALKIAAEIIDLLPKDKAPETTEKKEPFIHPTSIQGNIDKVEIHFILRAFEEDTLRSMGIILQSIVKQVIQKYPKSSANVTIKEQYRNMKLVLDQHPFVVDYAIEAIKRAGIKPVLSSVRGGTDGSRLSFMGLPCPNIFAGEHAFHSKQEWVSVQDMQKAIQTIVHLASIWEEKAK
ncbi:MAG: peptidase T [Bacteroidia bacterium]|nr:MAG: peptidase T [Bacteroidia bacterium]